VKIHSFGGSMRVAFPPWGKHPKRERKNDKPEKRVDSQKAFKYKVAFVARSR
jgi:hypothetical protein